MGKRCRLAALGATFALLVAACATTEAPRSPRASATSASRPTQDTVRFPDALADASFVGADRADGGCAAGDRSRLALFETASGEPLWSFPIPRPGGETILHDDAVFVSFGWDRDQMPGVGAIDLEERTPLWQRFLEEPAEEMAVVRDALIVVTRSEVRGLDIGTGEDLWVTGSEFQFSEVILDRFWGYALTNVAVHGINLRSGEVSWELPIERPDELAVRGGLLAVAGGTRVIAVDVAARSQLWDERVNRLGAGQLWVGADSVIVELAPAESPAGGLVALDRETGFERWRIDNVAEVHWPSENQLVTTVASPDFRGAMRYDLIALDASTGERRWELPTTGPADLVVLAVSRGRIVISEPHPVVAGIDRLRLVDTDDGTVVWETALLEPVDGARIEGGLFLSTYRTIETLVDDRGLVHMILGPGSSWTATLPDGIRQDVRITPNGTLAISGELSATCVGRALHEPAPDQTSTEDVVEAPTTSP